MLVDDIGLDVPVVRETDRLANMEGTVPLETF